MKKTKKKKKNEIFSILNFLLRKLFLNIRKRFKPYKGSL